MEDFHSNKKITHHTKSKKRILEIISELGKTEFNSKALLMVIGPKQCPWEGKVQKTLPVYIT